MGKNTYIKLILHIPWEISGHSYDQIYKRYWYFIGKCFCSIQINNIHTFNCTYMLFFFRTRRHAWHHCKTYSMFSVLYSSYSMYLRTLNITTFIMNKVCDINIITKKKSYKCFSFYIRLLMSKKLIL